MRVFIQKVVAILFMHFLFFALGITVVLSYSYSGFRWSGTTAGYSINSVFATSFRTAMRAADASWDAAGSRFRFSYLGTTARNPNVWSGLYNTDGYNDIGYFNNGNTGIIAATRTTGNTIYESDITLNIYYGYTTVGAPNSYDVQNVVTHEFGHWLELNDLYSILWPSYCGLSFESTMCGTIYYNETNKRTLEGDDKDGIKYIYGV